MLLAQLGPACRAPFNDPDQTGLLVSPTPGDYEGPIDLAVRNRTGASVTCAAFETDHCPSLATFFAELAPLADGESASLTEVTCAYVDISCTTPEQTPEEPPLRAWGWAINPPVEEE
jgi:hypothetical protein